MENENESKRSFWKGTAAGFCFATILAVMAFCVFILARERAGRDFGSRENITTAQEVARSSKVQEKMQKIAQIIDGQFFEDVDPDAIENYIYKGMLAGTGDVYSGYFSEEELQQFMEDASGSYSGIGVTMQYDSAMNLVKIVSLNKKGPAAQVDIRVGDYIYKVDGEEIPLENADTTELVSRIRGEEGTTVRLTLLRGDNRKEVEVEVERKSVEVETVTGQMLEGQIGYIKISQFEGLTAKQFGEQYQKLKDEGAKGLILDLRANPGGQVDSVCEIAGYFLPKGLVTYMEDKHGNRQEYPCNGKDIWDKPLTVLVDGNSASASEILAGAVRDYKAGTLLGTRTFGKGIVQQTIPLGDGTAVKVTFAKYYTPNGENIHGKGIEPDIEVKYEEPANGQESEDIDKDNQVLAAIENIKEQMAAE